MLTSRYAAAALGCAVLSAIAGCASASPSGAGTPRSLPANRAASDGGTTSAVRPAGEKIPAAAKAVTITEYLGLDAKGKPPAPVTVTVPVQVRELAATVNALALFPPGTMFSCPDATGGELKLEFSAAPGKTPLAVAVDLLTGCRQVVLTIDGKEQPALAGLSAATVFTIADLPWPVPGSSGKG